MQNSQLTKTQISLLETGKHLFSIYGYEGTSIRMLSAEAGVNNAAFSFHFQSKENFYCEVLKYTADELSGYFETRSSWNPDIDFASLSKEEALDIISSLVKEHLHVAIDLTQPDMLRLVYWEQTYTPNGVRPIMNTLEKYSEDFLAKLLEAYWKDNNIDEIKCRLISRLINGGIMSFGEHEVFLSYIGKNADHEWSEWAKKTIYDFVMYSIQNFKNLETL